ncbi:hypothetical protein MTO96_000039 [Rhipicephalus appendiculatus]
MSFSSRLFKKGAFSIPLFLCRACTTASTKAAGRHRPERPEPKPGGQQDPGDVPGPPGSQEPAAPTQGTRGTSRKGKARDQADDASKELPDELKDMDLNDPDLAKAAVKIQATFRGYKTRAKPE